MLERAADAYAAGRQIFQWRAVEAEQKLGLLGTGAYENNLRRSTYDHTETLEKIEAIGWRLDSVSREFRPTGSKSRDKFWSSGQQSAVAGESVAVYLFRREAR